MKTCNICKNKFEVVTEMDANNSICGTCREPLLNDFFTELAQIEQHPPVPDPEPDVDSEPVAQSGTVFYTPTEELNFLLSDLVSEVADAEQWHAMYGEDWNADGFLSSVADLTVKLMRVANQLPDGGKPKVKP